MRLGIGGLGWRPADFWSATLTEFFEAIRGYNDAQGGEEKPKANGAPNKNEMAELLARYG